eukprot:scaffold1248_cov170-Amphora_coffeaeformis.AAC.2
MEESKLFPPVPDFYCSERSERIDPEDVVPSVIFRCTLPSHAPTKNQQQQQSLEFVCREPSCGALLPTEHNITLDEQADEAPMDPNFFDDGYTLAGRTGFQVWTGTRILMEALLFWRSATTTTTTTTSEKYDTWTRLGYWHDRIRQGANIVELGAGVGVVGTSMAAVGAHVLLTDLPTLVENSVQPNLERNRVADSPMPLEETTCPPTWLGPQGVPIGQGSHTRQPSLLLSFQRRDSKDGDESKSFTTVNRVISEVKAREWSMDCLAWRPVVVGDDKSEVFVFEIIPNASAA